MLEDVLLVERKEPLCTLTINRPERRNALTPEIMFRVGDLLHEMASDDEIRVVVIRGSGELSFSSGMDLGTSRGERERFRERKEHPIEYITSSIVDYPAPVIAMIYGYAVGAGLDLATSCDIRLAAAGARLGMPPARLGGIYNAGAIQRFISLVGPAHAKELFFHAGMIDAEEAARIGLVNHVVPPAELVSTTYKLAETIADNAPLSVRGTKAIVHKLLACQKLALEDELEIRALMDAAEKSEDRREGGRAFAEKRKPVFKGR